MFRLKLPTDPRWANIAEGNLEEMVTVVHKLKERFAVIDYNTQIAEETITSDIPLQINDSSIAEEIICNEKLEEDKNRYMKRVQKLKTELDSKNHTIEKLNIFLDIQDLILL
jgi:hypothetical protein